MKEINLDAATWRDRDDFYDALLPALGAPTWHGRSLYALTDTLGADDINDVKLPLHIKIANAVRTPPELLSYLKRLALLVDAAAGTVCGTVGDSRTEADFVAFLEHLFDGFVEHGLACDLRQRQHACLGRRRPSGGAAERHCR